jgi:ankyrin repeat protein
MASTKLFYSQRLGEFSDEDPSATMIWILAPINILLLLGPAFSVVLFATYFEGFFLLSIGVMVLMMFFFFKVFYYTKEHIKDIIKHYYSERKETGTRDSELLFFTAALTSWISPCTVWKNNKKWRSKFILKSSLFCHILHLINLLSIYLLVDHGYFYPPDHTPITHCINETNQANFSNFRYTNSYENSTLFEICQSEDTCLPGVRICSETENPQDFLNHYLLPTGIALLILSFFASAILQFFGNNNHLVKYHNFFCCCNRLGIDAEEHIQRFENNDLGKVWRTPPLHKAVQKNNFALFCFLNFLGGDCGAVNGQPKSSITMLLEKIVTENNEYTAQFEQLFCLTKWWIKRAKGRYGKFALHNASALGDIDSVKKLVANGYDIDLKNEEQKTPILLAAVGGHIDCWKYMVEDRCDFTLIETTSHAALHIVIGLKDLESFQYLIEKKADVNTKSSEGKTPLHVACQVGLLSFLECLIEEGANIDAKDSEGKTPLHLATELEVLDCLDHLIEKNAELVKDNRGQTPLHYAAKILDGFYPLKRLTERFQDRYDGDAINDTDHKGMTPLHLAAANGHPRSVQYLIDNQANINAIDQYGNTPLHLIGQDAIVTGKHVNVNGCIEIAKILKDAGADLTVVNKKGEANTEFLKFLKN